MMFRHNPNHRASRERYAALRAEAAGPRKGDVIRVRRDDASVDVVRVLDTYTSAASGIAMLTVRNSPYGIQSFAVRADAVLGDDVPDVRLDAIDCCGGLCLLHKAEAAGAARDVEWEAGL
jgi:hypothetical protein